MRNWAGFLAVRMGAVRHGLTMLILAGLLAALAGLAMPLQAQQAPAAPAIPDIEKPSADASTGQPRDLEPRPSLRIKGQSTWDDGFNALKSAIALLEADAKRLGLAVQGHPLAHFVDSDDLGFTYETYLPLGAPATPGQALSTGVEPASTPAGKTMMFTHDGAYDEIDSAYEAITAWLDEKGLTATGRFVEEYLALPEKADDTGMKLNIFVFLK